MLLAPMFLAFLPEPARLRICPVALESTLSALVAAARAEHTQLELTDDDLSAHLAERVGPDLVEAPDPIGLLASIHAPDLALALACQRGDASALVAFDRLFASDIDLAIKKSPGLGIATDEFRQLVRTRLFVAEPERPAKIASYSGKGPLRSWVRVTATRLVLDLARRDDGERPGADDGFFDRLPAAVDLESDVIRAASRRDLEDAMRRAFAGLEVRERNLLRQRYLHDLSGERIAQMYGVHRATAFGWIEEARRALLVRVRRELGGRTKGRELESLLAVLGSRLDISLRGVMRSDDGAEPVKTD